VVPACVDVTFVWLAYSFTLCSDYTKILPVIVVMDVPGATSVAVNVV
jgi:hypothetical protein